MPIKYRAKSVAGKSRLYIVDEKQAEAYHVISKTTTTLTPKSIKALKTLGVECVEVK